MRIVSGSSSEVIYFVAFSSADHVSRVGGLTSFDVWFANSTVAASTSHNMTVVEMASPTTAGIYALRLLDSTVTALGAGIDSRELLFHITSSMDPVTRTVEVYRRTVTTGQTLVVNSSGKTAVDDLILAKVTSINAETTAIVAKLSSMDTTIGVIAAKVSSIDTDIDTALTRLSSLGTHTDTILTRTSPNNIGAAVWDAQTTGYNVLGSFGQVNYVKHRGSATAGGNNTITMDSSGSTTDSFHVNDVITLTSGTGAGQSRVISAQTSRLLTVTDNWFTNPASGSGFFIQPFPPSDIATVLDGIATDVTNIDTNVDAVLEIATSVNTNVDTALGNLSTVLTKVTSINAETTAIVAKVTSIDTDIDTALTRLSSLGTHVDTVVSKVTSVDSRLSSMDTMLSSVNAKVTSIDTDIDTALTRLSSLGTHVDTCVTKVTSIDTRVTAIQAQTTQLVFTQSGKVDANIHYVNNVQVNGVGSTANPWGP